MSIFHDDFKAFWQFVKFTLVGFTNSIIYIIVFNLFMLINEETTTALIGSSVAWFTSTTNSFFLNKRFAFKGIEIILWKAILKFYLGYIFTSLVLYSILTFVQMEILNVNPSTVPVINVLIVGPVNFFIAKYWSFKENKEAKVNEISKNKKG